MPSKPLPWSREADIVRTLKTLPQENFIRAFVEWMEQVTDAPLFYALGASLPLVSALSPPNLYLSNGPGGIVNTNFYSLVLGRQGFDRKTTSIKQAAILLGEVAPSRLGADPGSVQGLVNSLCEQSQQMLEYPDFADFLAQTKARTGGNFLSALKTTFLHCWDGRPLSSRLSRTTVRCESPRLNILGAINGALLAEHAEITDFLGGLFSRFCFFSARRERRHNMPPGNAALFQSLRLWCEATLHAAPNTFGACVGFTPDALSLWKEFNLGVEESVSLLPDERFAGVHARSPTHALKIALLLCFASGYGHPVYGNGGKDWRIDTRHMQVAIDIAIRCYMGSIAVFDSVGGSRDMVNRASVLDSIGDVWCRRGHIARRSKLLLRTLEPILDTLVCEGMIETAREMVPATGLADPVQSPDPKLYMYRRAPNAPLEDGVQAALDVHASVVEAQRRVRAGLIPCDDAAPSLFAGDSSSASLEDKIIPAEAPVIYGPDGVPLKKYDRTADEEDLGGGRTRIGGADGFIIEKPTHVSGGTVYTLDFND